MMKLYTTTHKLSNVHKIVMQHNTERIIRDNRHGLCLWFRINSTIFYYYIK